MWGVFLLVCYGKACEYYYPHSQPEAVAATFEECLERLDRGFNFSNIVPPFSTTRWECLPYDGPFLDVSMNH